MQKVKTALAWAWRSPRIRKDVLDIAKVIVGVIGARYGIKIV